jgi:uncharacterized protein DUF3293
MAPACAKPQVNDNQLIRDQSMSATDELWSAYESTIFCAKVDGVTINIEPGRHNSTLDGILESRAVTTWAFITAWNPSSRLLTPEENASRQNRLEADINGLGYEMFTGVGQPAEGNWLPEQSVLILGISKEDAIALGGKYGQLAIVVGQYRQAATLVRCLPR